VLSSKVDTGVAGQAAFTIEIFFHAVEAVIVKTELEAGSYLQEITP